MYDEQHSDDAVTYELTRKVVEACHLSKRKKFAVDLSGMRASVRTDATVKFAVRQHSKQENFI